MDTPILVGAKEIQAFLGGRSWDTILKWIDRGCPIRRIDGRWTAERSLLTAWVQGQLEFATAAGRRAIAP